MTSQDQEQQKDAITIEKILVRDSIDQPQALMVIGTTAISGDVWVRLGTDAHTPTNSIPHDAICEMAKIVSAGSRSEAKVSSLYQQANGARKDKPQYFYGVTCSEDRSIWVADFYESDHQRWNRLEQANTDINDLWQQTILDDDPAKPLKVTAWQQTLQASDPATQAQDPGGEKIGQVRAMKPSGATTVDILRTDIGAADKYQVGVLFIHGIGNHSVRDTLTKFGEPIIDFWDQVFRRTTEAARSRMPVRMRSLVEKLALRGALLNRQDRDGIVSVTDDFGDKHANDADQQSTKGSDRTDMVCASIRVEDSYFPAVSEHAPVCSSVRLSGLGVDGKAHESHVLLAESYWTDKTVYPSAKELFAWINTALPATLSLYVSATLRPELDVLRSTRKEPKASKSNDKSERKLSNRLVAHASHGKLGLSVAFFVFLIRAVLLVFLLPTMVIAQILLYGLAFASLIPNATIKRAVRGLIDLMMGTVGQSYALKTSPIRRNAIIAKTQHDLDWLCSRCEEVVVISHSQGAEVARLLLRGKRWHKVKRWFSLGAGIKPLLMLDPNRDALPFETTFKRFFGVCSISTILFAVAWICTPLLGGNTPELRFGIWLVWSGCLGVGTVYYVLLCIFGSNRTLAFSFKFNPWIRPHWTDFFATHDPVPAGSLFDSHHSEIQQSLWDPAPGENCRQLRIDNYQSTLRDHTSYFENTEQFVGPIATELLSMLGFKVNAKQRDGIFREATQRRREIVYALMVWNKLLAGALMVFSLAVLIDSGWTWFSQIVTTWRESDSAIASVHTLWFSGFFHTIANVFMPALVVFFIAKITIGFIMKRKFDASKNQLLNDIAIKTSITASRVHYDDPIDESDTA